MRVDCHSHTTYSFDAFSSPKSLVQAARRAGLDALAVTDHNTARAWKELRALSRQFRFPVIFGEEIKTPAGDIIGLFLNREIRPAEPLDVIDQIKEQDGIAVLPHPFDSYRKFKNPHLIARKIDAVEVFNSRVIRGEENTQALRFAKKHRLGFSAGSDAHASFEVGRACAASPGDSVDEFRKALAKGKTTASGAPSSPLVHLISTLAKTGIRI